MTLIIGRLVGCFGFSGPVRQYFNLYQAVSQREGERREKGQKRVRVNMSKQLTPAPIASAIGPCPTIIQIVGRPGTGSLPRTIAPPYHPHHRQRVHLQTYSNICFWWFYILQIRCLLRYKFTIMLTPMSFGVFT